MQLSFVLLHNFNLGRHDLVRGVLYVYMPAPQLVNAIESAVRAVPLACDRTRAKNSSTHERQPPSQICESVFKI
jgi:hypothetical protein